LYDLDVLIWATPDEQHARDPGVDHHVVNSNADNRTNTTRVACGLAAAIGQ
jgi:hypothetical protein